VSTTIISVRDHGASGDGITDDTEAIIATTKAAGSNATVYFPRGRYRITRTITVPQDQTWRGAGIDDSNLATRMPSNCLLTEVADGPAIDATYNTRFEHLHLRGSGHGVAMRVRGRVRLDDVNIQHHETAIVADQLWYGHFSGLRLYRNHCGLDITHSYNLTLVEPRFMCVTPDDRPGVGIRLDHDVDLKVFGGSIEGYGTGIISTGVKNSVHIYSTYFETSPPVREYGSDGGATAIKFSGSRASSLSVMGCYVYLHNTRWFIDASGKRTQVAISAINNHYQGGNPLAQGGPHQAYRWTNGSEVQLHLVGDLWDVDFPENSWWAEPDFQVGRAGVASPPPGSMQGRHRAGEMITGRHLVVEGQATLGLGRVQRLPGYDKDERDRCIGAMLFHEPAGRPIVWNGRQWVFFDGTPVPRSAEDLLLSAGARARDLPLGPIPLAWKRLSRFASRQWRWARGVANDKLHR